MRGAGWSGKNEFDFNLIGIGARNYGLGRSARGELVEKKLELVREFKRIMKKRGYDALIYKNTSPMETGKVRSHRVGRTDRYWEPQPEINFETVSDVRAIIVFDSNQIKSATGNTGSFDPNDPSIIKEFIVKALKNDMIVKESQEKLCL
jgi:hypothetical protein